MPRIKRTKFNLKRNSAGCYVSPDGRYYVVRSDSGWWAVGEQTPAGSEHIEDFKSYAEARNKVVQLLGGYAKVLGGIYGR